MRNQHHYTYNHAMQYIVIIRLSLQLEQDVRKLKVRLRLANNSLIQARSQMELQSLRTKQLISAWESRLSDANDALLRQRQLKDSELLELSSQLLYLRGSLIKEQKRVVSLLAEKDTTINTQQTKILKLTRSNVKLKETIRVFKQWLKEKDVLRIINNNNNNHHAVGLPVKSDNQHEHLDFPDVFHDSGDIRAPNDFLGLPSNTEKQSESKWCISKTPSPSVSPRLDHAPSSTNQSTERRSHARATSLGTIHTLPKQQKPILKHSQSHALLSVTKASFDLNNLESTIDEATSAPTPPTNAAANQTAATSTNTAQQQQPVRKPLRQSRSSGNLLADVSARPLVFNIAPQNRAHSIDLDAPEVIEAKAPSSSSTQKHKWYHSLTRRASLQPAQPSSRDQINGMTSLGVAKNGARTLPRNNTSPAMSLSSAAAGADHDDEPMKKNSGVKSKSSGRQRKRSTSEPGAEAQTVIAALRAGIEQQRRGRIHSYEEVI